MKNIGVRIKSERQNMKWSQSQLIELLKEKKIFIGRNTLSQIENGTHDFNNFSLGLLIALCGKDFFNCEIGYLLCEYDCKTRRNADISKETGLTDDAINALRTLHTPTDFSTKDSVQINRYDIIALNLILEDFYKHYTEAEEHQRFSDDVTDTPLNLIGRYIDSNSAEFGNGLPTFTQNGFTTVYSPGKVAKEYFKTNLYELLEHLRNNYSIDIIARKRENDDYFDKLYKDYIKESLRNLDGGDSNEKS